MPPSSRTALVGRTPYVCPSCSLKLRAFSSCPSASIATSRLSLSRLPRRDTIPLDFQRDQRRWLTQNYIRKTARADEDWSNRAIDIKHGRKHSVLEMLEERGFVNQIVGHRDVLKHLLDNRRVGVYAGIDPTAPSMHVGHMVPFMALSWMYVHGYHVHFLLGGSTARIGDPEGRLQARGRVGGQTHKANITKMHMQLKRFGASMEKYAERRGYQKEWAWRRSLINNQQWYVKSTLVEFLRSMGSLIRLGPMLGRDTVKNRQEKGDGMSFAEFTYPLMQAWDWWQLFQKGVQVQIGGADQFGNILQGAEAVKQAAKYDTEHSLRLEQEEKVRAKQEGVVVSDDPMGWTVPLLTTANGEKFGKSAGNAVWLDKDMTSVFDLYQFFVRSADADVERYLKLFTFLSMENINAIMKEHKQDESKRVAQHKLAREFVELVHGLEAAEEAEEQHRRLFDKTLTVSDIQQSMEYAPRVAAPHGKGVPDLHPRLNKHAKPQDLHSNASTRATLPRSLVIGQPLSRILHSAGLTASRSEGQRLINSGGVYIGAQSSGKEPMDDAVNYIPANDSSKDFVSRYIIDDNLLILRTGKWRVKVIEIVPDEEFRAAGLSCPGWETQSEVNKSLEGNAKSNRRPSELF